MDAFENRICASVGSAPQVTNVAAGHSYVHVSCVATGRFIFLSQPNDGACLEILEFEVVGRRQGCTNCAGGLYTDFAGATTCSSCPFSWVEQESAPWKTATGSGADNLNKCKCRKGLTGTGKGFTQNFEKHRPTYRGVGEVWNFSVYFNQTNSHFLYWPLQTGPIPHEFHVESNGGLTIVVKVKFMGDVEHGESILDFGNAEGSTSDNIVLGRYESSGKMIAYIAQGNDSSVCTIVSTSDIIVQDEWMTIMFLYEASTNEMSLKKNGQIVAGPTACSTTPRDRNVTKLLLGKSNFATNAFFHGEMMGLYIADEVLRDLTRVCNFTRSTGGSHPCDALQSSTWTPDAGIQYHRDQGLAGPALPTAPGNRTAQLSAFFNSRFPKSSSHTTPPLCRLRQTPHNGR